MSAIVEWLKAKGWAFARTFVAIATPFLLQYLQDRAGFDYKIAISMTGMTLILFVVTSLKEIPDPGTAPAWQVLVWRFLRQFGQVLGAAIGTAVFVTDVQWSSVLVTTAVSAFSTVILGSYVVQPSTVPSISTTVVNTVPAEPEVLTDLGSSELSFPSEEADYEPARALIE